MSRSPVVLFTLALAAALVFPAAAHAQQQLPCNLQITVTCNAGSCTANTINAGTNACSGMVATGFEALGATDQVSFTNLKPGISLSQCFDSSSFPQQTQGYNFAMCFGPGSLAPGASFTSSVSVGGANAAGAQILGFTLVEDTSTSSNNLLGLAYAFANSNVATCTPTANVPSATLSGVPYSVSWSAVSEPNATYIVDESTTADFSTIAASQTTSSLSAQFQHSVTSTTTYYYRVHAVTCSGAPGTNSTAVSIKVLPPPATNQNGATDVVVPFGTTASFAIPMSVTLGSGKAGYSYSASMDKPYYTVTPATGTVPASGQLQLIVTANPANLPAGASTGTLQLVLTPPATANGVRALDSTTVSLPVSVTLVTPVTPGGKSLPPANALIIPVVTHVVGQGNTPFVSDVRMTNGGASAVTYQVTYTPANTDGTTNGQITTLTVAPGQTVALNDIAKDFFGVGASGTSTDVGSGALEIRPQNSAALTTYASSRTYAQTSGGTYGQFIAAIPFSQFASQFSITPPLGGVPAPANTTLSLQQVAQSDKFRTNLGLVEGSGTPATGSINVYDDSGNLVKSAPLALQAGQQTQMSLASLGVSNLDDGRIEIQLTSQTGAVTGYASVLDNTTQDPLAVSAVAASAVNSSRYLIPGIAEYVFGDGRNFHSDVRVFNGGSSAMTVTPTLYGTDATGKPVTLAGQPFTLQPKQVQRMDNVLASYFNLGAGANYGGSVVFTTPSDSSLVVTGRTYSNAASGGTFGQFIPGVTPTQGIGAGDKPLQILQLEDSAQFRSNVGLAEVSGNPVDGKLTLYLPDSKSAPVLNFHLDANQFQQLNSLIKSMVGSTVYNARVMVEVTGGTGRLTAYGSVIDNQSTDPTYVPAQ